MADLFKELDLNGDGKITLDEIFKILDDNEKPVPKNAIKTMFTLSDSDGNGSVDKREFQRFFRLIQHLEKKSLEHAVFLIADVNNDNIGEKKELQKICKLLGWQAPKADKMNEEEFTKFTQESMGVDKDWYDKC